MKTRDKSNRIKLMNSMMETHDTAKQFLIDNCSSINNIGTSQMSPFYNNRSEAQITTLQEEINASSKLNNKSVEFINKHHFPLELKFIYLIINNEKSEIQLNKGFNFLKLEEIIENKDKYEHFIDIGIKYWGMGHILVLSLTKNTGELFFRTDGGSSGWDTGLNFSYYVSFNPIKEYPKKIMSFSNVKYIVTSDLLENVYFGQEWFENTFVHAHKPPLSIN